MENFGSGACFLIYITMGLNMRKFVAILAFLLPSVTLAVLPPPKGKWPTTPLFMQPENWSPLPAAGQALTPEQLFMLFANIKVSDDALTRPQQEPYIAIQGNQVYALFKDWRLGSKQTFFARSTDSGDSWQANYRIIEPTYPNHSDPVIRVHPSGNLFACILGHGSGSNVFVARSTNQGVSFDTAKLASINSADAFQDKNWMELGPSGNLYVTWTAFLNAGPLDIRFVRSTNGGVSWSSWIRLNDNPPNGTSRQGSQALEGPGGVLHAIWGWDDRDGTEGIYITTSADSGKTFGPNRFVANQYLNDIMPWRTGFLPSATVDKKNGNIYIAWYDSRFRSGYTDIAFVRSTDGGQSWDSAIFVNGNLGDSTQQFMPAIAVDPVGRIFLMWYDTRVSGGNVVDVFYSYSEDYGKTWAPELRVSSVGSVPAFDSYSSSVMGDYNGLAADGTALYGDWGDSRNGNQDIYFTRIPTPFIWGDLNSDGLVDAADVVFLLNRVFLNRPLLAGETHADLDCDGFLTASDVVAILNQAFLGIEAGCF